jgi:hypothetical protein
MSEPTEREDLEQLLVSAGWLRLLDHIKTQWGSAAFARRIKHAITDAMEKHEDPAQAALRVNAQHDAINALLLYPQERVSMLLGHEAVRKKEQEPTMSRRGTL